MHSSNVYMFKTALKLAGDPYYSGMGLPTDISEGGQKLRKGLIKSDWELKQVLTCQMKQ